MHFKYLRSWAASTKRDIKTKTKTSPGMESFARHEKDLEVKIIPSAKTTCVCSLIGKRSPLWL